MNNSTRLLIQEIRKSNISLPEKNKICQNARHQDRLDILKKHHVILYKSYLELGENGFLFLLEKYLRNNKNEITVKMELERVANALNMSSLSICSNTRKREVVQARQLAMFCAKHNTKASLAMIGAEIGNKDHATVLHSCKTIKNLLQTSVECRNEWTPILIGGCNTNNILLTLPIIC